MWILWCLLGTELWQQPRALNRLCVLTGLHKKCGSSSTLRAKPGKTASGTSSSIRGGTCSELQPGLPPAGDGTRLLVATLTAHVTRTRFCSLVHATVLALLTSSCSLARAEQWHPRAWSASEPKAPIVTLTQLRTALAFSSTGMNKALISVDEG